jgi:hypothetical protein
VVGFGVSGDVPVDSVSAGVEYPIRCRVVNKFQGLVAPRPHEMSLKTPIFPLSVEFASLCVTDAQN